MKTLQPPTVGGASRCGAALGQPLGTDTPPGSSFHEQASGNLGKQLLVRLHLLTDHPRAAAEPPEPTGRTPATLLDLEERALLHAVSTETAPPKVLPALEILAEECYVNLREPAK